MVREGQKSHTLVVTSGGGGYLGMLGRIQVMPRWMVREGQKSHTLVVTGGGGGVSWYAGTDTGDAQVGG